MRSIFATVDDLAEWEPPSIPFMQEAFCADLQGSFVYSRDALGSDTTNQALITPASGSGRWVRRDLQFTYRIAVSAATANDAALITVPTGFRLKILMPAIQVDVAFTGGTTPAIGVSTTAAGSSSDGDLLGGEVGMVEADLTVGYRGVPGPVYTDPPRTVVLVGGDIIRWNRITDVFAAGSGFLHVPVIQLRRNA